MIDKQNVRDCRKRHKAYEEHFNLEVTVSPKSNEDSDENTQSTEDFAIRCIYAKLTKLPMNRDQNKTQK